MLSGWCTFSLLLAGSEPRDSDIPKFKVVPKMWSPQTPDINAASVCLDVDTMVLIVSITELGVCHTLTLANDHLNQSLPVRTKLTLVPVDGGESVVKMKTYEHKNITTKR